jgi:hypothetical protein
MKLRLVFLLTVFILSSCDGPEIPLLRPSNPAPVAKPGTLAINVSSTIMEYDSVSIKYYPNYRVHPTDSIPQPVLVILADSSIDTVHLNLANAALDTGTYFVANNMNPGSTFAYFEAPSYSPPPSYYGSFGYILVNDGHIAITSCDTSRKIISGEFSFDQNTRSPQLRLYLDGTFFSIPYLVVQ